MTVKKICSNCNYEESYENILLGHCCKLTRVKDGERKKEPDDGKDGFCRRFSIRSNLITPEKRLSVIDICHSSVE